jgi:hypothetical protein
MVTVGIVIVGTFTVGIVTVGTLTVGVVTSTVGAVMPVVVEVLLSLLKTIVSSIRVYPVGLVTPVVVPSVVVTEASPLAAAPPVVVPAIVGEDDPPEMVGAAPPPILPNTPKPNNNPMIKARRAKIPKSGHNHFGHPDFSFLALVSLIGSTTGAVT